MTRRRIIGSILCGVMLIFASVALSQISIQQIVNAAEETDTDTVMSVQNALNAAGYDCGTADGVTGSQTVSAIQQYQEDKGLAVSGEIDDALLISLGLSGITMNGVTGDTEFETSDSKLILTGYEIGSDYNGNDALILYCNYTNNGSTGRYAVMDFYFQVYQNGIARDSAFPEYQGSWQEANNNSTTNIKDGASLDIAIGYQLENISDPVEIEVQEFVTFKDTWTFSIDFSQNVGATSIDISDISDEESENESDDALEEETASESETESVEGSEGEIEEDRTVYAPDMVLTGTVVEATMNTVTLQTEDGSTYLCATEDTEFDLAGGGIMLGMEVEVTLESSVSDEYGLFTAEKISDNVNGVSETEPETETEEDRSVTAPDTVLTGTVVEATMNTITLQTEDGSTYLCTTEDTEFDLAGGGIMLGMEVEVTLESSVSDEYGLFTAEKISDDVNGVSETEPETEVLEDLSEETEEETEVDIAEESEDVFTVSSNTSDDMSLFDEIFVSLADQVDSLTYQEGVSYLDSYGIKYDAEAPEGGYSGQVTTEEDGNGFKIYAFFSENNKGEDTLDLLSYSNGDYEVSVSDNTHTSGNVYNIYQKNAVVKNREVSSLSALETFIHTDLPEILKGNDSNEYLKDSASAETSYKLKYGNLVSTSESKSETGTGLIVKAKITSSYSNEATINQNYMNVFDLIQNQGCDKYDEIQYWAVADMSNGEESKVVSFTVDKNLIQEIKEDKIVDITLGDYVDDLFIHSSLLE